MQIPGYRHGQQMDPSLLLLASLLFMLLFFSVSPLLLLITVSNLWSLWWCLWYRVFMITQCRRVSAQASRGRTFSFFFMHLAPYCRTRESVGTDRCTKTR